MFSKKPPETMLSLHKEIEKAREQVTGRYYSSKPMGARTPITIEDLVNAGTATKFGKLYSFSPDERDQLNALRNLVVRYIDQPSPSRPLCLAVFGPPGSGKSFAVKQVRAEVEKRLRDDLVTNGGPTASSPVELKPKLPMTTLNLTQVAAPHDLARVLARMAGEQDDDTVPIVFFDEFDAPRNAASYGWLAWFLAPMNDGEIVHEGAIFRLKRAVYVFAGGTAATMDEFSSHSNDTTFRSAKGPDFVSRLHGYLNVEGPNVGPHMLLRRALILRNALEERVKTMKEGLDFEPASDLIDAMLRVGRYRHGARSIKAVIETSDLGQGTFGFDHLAEDHLLKLHADRGPLDRDAIGGCIVLSGYAKEDDDGQSLEGTWLDLAKDFWQQGATLAYGGRWEDLSPRGGGTLARVLVDEAWSLPRALRRHNDPRPRLLCFKPDASMEREELPDGLRFEELPSAPKTEREGLKVQFADDANRAWIETVLRQFRKRLHMTELSVARFAITGSTQGYPGRFPGIAEEVMLSLALRRPVYIAGGFGGAAEHVGTLLGLARPWTGEQMKSFIVGQDRMYRMDFLEKIRDKLRPPPWSNLPVTMLELIDFLKGHAIGGDNWPDNGLDVDDNRKLFRSEDTAEIANLVKKGLLKIFGK